MGSDFCLKKKGLGCYQLNQNHQFYFQIQAQMNIVNVEYADFVVWPDNGVDSLYVERVTKDEAFFNRIASRVTTFFSTSVLPELLGRWSTVPRKESIITGNQWCYCKGEEREGEMLVCQSGRCLIKKFHKKCLRFNLERKVPKTWRCPNCVKILNKERRDRKKITSGEDR